MLAGSEYFVYFGWYIDTVKMSVRKYSDIDLT